MFEFRVPYSQQYLFNAIPEVLGQLVTGSTGHRVNWSPDKLVTGRQFARVMLCTAVSRKQNVYNTMH